MKHNSMSPFMSKLAGERGLFYMHVVAVLCSRLWRGARGDLVSSPGTVQPTHRASESKRITRDTLTLNSCPCCISESGKTAKPKKINGHGCSRRPGNERVHPGLLFTVHANLIKKTGCLHDQMMPYVVLLPPNLAFGQLQDQLVTWFQKCLPIVLQDW